MKKLFFLSLIALYSSVFYANSTVQVIPIDTINNVGMISMPSDSIEKDSHVASYSSLYELPRFLMMELLDSVHAVGLFVALFLLLLLVAMPLIISIYVIRQVSKIKLAKYEYLQDIARRGIAVPPTVQSSSIQSKQFLYQAIYITSFGVGLFLMGVVLSFTFLISIGILVVCFGGGKIIIYSISLQSRDGHSEHANAENTVPKNIHSSFKTSVPIWGIVLVALGGWIILLSMILHMDVFMGIMGLLLVIVGGIIILMRYLAQRHRND